MTTGPFIHSGSTTRMIMLQTIAALSPVCAAAVWRYGTPALVLLAVSVATACLTDWICQRRKGFDVSAVITGIIFALILPPSVPWGLAVVGAALAIGFGKYFFGGLGQNLFNPAVLARVMLMALVPAYLLMPRWTFGGVTQASPLAKEIDAAMPSAWSLMTGFHPGTLAEAVPAAVLIGGIILLARRVIGWYIPLCYLATIALLALALPASDRMAGHVPWLVGNPIIHLLGGGTLITAFFLLTDPVTSPFSIRGRVIYAVLAGVFTMLIRFYTPYPDGAAFAILLGNAAVPMIDQYTLRRVSTARLKGQTAST